MDLEEIDDPLDVRVIFQAFHVFFSVVVRCSHCSKVCDERFQVLQVLLSALLYVLWTRHQDFLRIGKAGMSRRDECPEPQMFASGGVIALEVVHVDFGGGSVWAIVLEQPLRSSIDVAVVNTSAIVDEGAAMDDPAGGVVVLASAHVLVFLGSGGFSLLFLDHPLNDFLKSGVDVLQVVHCQTLALAIDEDFRVDNVAGEHTMLTSGNVSQQMSLSLALLLHDNFDVGH